MRELPCLSFTAMALTAIMIGSAAAGLTLLPPSERSYHDHYEAAVRGDPDAQARLAVFHANEAGGPQSNAYALQWFIRAAGQGHAQAQLMLSEIFAAGKGVPRNNLAAYKWASVAAASAREPQTTENAVAMLKLLAPQMSQAQIVEARSLAAGWKPKPEVRQANNDQPTENRGSRPATPVSVPTSSSTQSRARETRADCGIGRTRHDAGQVMATVSARVGNLVATR